MNPSRPSTPPAVPLEHVPLVAIVLGLISGLLLVGHAAGIGVTAVGLAAIVALRSRATSRWSRGWLVAAAALVVAPAIRDADWLVSLSLLGAVTLAAVAVTDAATWRQLGAAAPAWLTDAARVGAALPRHTASRLRPTQRESLAPVARGLAIAAPIAGLFALLFAWADRAFAELLTSATRVDVSVSDLALRAGIGLLVVSVITALLRVSSHTDEREGAAVRDPQHVEWTVILASVVAVFAAFLGTQLHSTIQGHEYVQTTTGLTYAQYAREGFAQLSLVAALTLGLLARFGLRGTTRARTPRLLAGVLCVLALAVVASAWWRLSLYEDAFGATRTRFFIHLCLVWCAGVFLMILATGAARRASLIPRLIVSLTAVLAVGTVALNPDGLIAAQNVERGRAGETIDLAYLGSLSTDADAAIAQLPADERACVRRRPAQDGALVAWSWTRAQSPELQTGRGTARDGCGTPGR